jgi:hypothetical protein
MTTVPLVRSMSDGTLGISVGGSPLARSAPEPRNSLGTWLSTAGSAVASVGSTVADITVPGMNIGSLTDLLNQQIQFQQIMQRVSMASNVLRSQHEAEMAPIRNMRVG